MDNVFGTDDELEISWSGRGYNVASLNALIAASTRMRDTTLTDVKDFVEKNRDLEVDDVDKSGRTALMIACLLGKEDVVQFLLQEGANPNKTSKELNTSLHYACRIPDVELSDNEIDSTPRIRNNFKTKSWFLVKLLVEHGAAYKHNIHGWTPGHYAAFYGMSDVVHYFMEDGKVAMEDTDRIKTLEILFFAISVFQDSCLDVEDMYKHLSKILQLRTEKQYPVQKNRRTQLEVILGQSECSHSQDIQASMKVDKHFMTVQGFLIGDRVFPASVKKKWLWPCLMRMSFLTSMHDFIHICQSFLKLETQGEIDIGTAMSGIVDLLYYSYPRRKQEITNAIQNRAELHSIFRAYKDILRNASPECLVQSLHVRDIYNHLFQVQNAIVHYIYMAGEEICTSYTRSFAELVGVVKAVAVKCQHKNTTLKPFVFNLYKYTAAATGFFEIEGSTDEKDKFRMVMHFYSFLFQYEDPFYQDTNTGETILHHLICYLYKYERGGFTPYSRSCHHTNHVELVLPVLRMAIRFGCPVGLKDKDGRTPQSLAEGLETQFEEEPGNCEKYTELLELLSSSLVEMSLQELATRVILQKKIPYHHHGIPKRVIDDIENGLRLKCK